MALWGGIAENHNWGQAHYSENCRQVQKNKGKKCYFIEKKQAAGKCCSEWKLTGERDVRVRMVSHWLSWWGGGAFFWSIIALLFYVNFCCTRIHVSTPSWVSLPPHWIFIECWAELPELYCRLPLAISFTHGSVFTSNLVSWLIPPSLSPMSTHPFSASASLLLPWD